jgi:hypothetical protein
MGTVLELVRLDIPTDGGHRVHCKNLNLIIYVLYTDSYFIEITRKVRIERRQAFGSAKHHIVASCSVNI